MEQARRKWCRGNINELFIFQVLSVPEEIVQIGFNVNS